MDPTPRSTQSFFTRSKRLIFGTPIFELIGILFISSILWARDLENRVSMRIHLFLCQLLIWVYKIGMQLDSQWQTRWGSVEQLEMLFWKGSSIPYNEKGIGLPRTIGSNDFEFMSFNSYIYRNFTPRSDSWKKFMQPTPIQSFGSDTNEVQNLYDAFCFPVSSDAEAASLATPEENANQINSDLLADNCDGLAQLIRLDTPTDLFSNQMDLNEQVFDDDIFGVDDELMDQQGIHGHHDGPNVSVFDEAQNLPKLCAPNNKTESETYTAKPYCLSSFRSQISSRRKNQRKLFLQWRRVKVRKAQAAQELQEKSMGTKGFSSPSKLINGLQPGASQTVDSPDKNISNSPSPKMPISHSPQSSTKSSQYSLNNEDQISSGDQEDENIEANYADSNGKTTDGCEPTTPIGKRQRFKNAFKKIKCVQNKQL